MLEALRVRDRLATRERFEHAANTARVRCLLRANRKSAGERLIFALERHWADGEHRFRVDRERVTREVVRVFAREHRAHEHREVLLLHRHARRHRSVDGRDGFTPRFHRLQRIKRVARSCRGQRQARIRVDKLPAVTHFVGDPPLVDVVVLPRLDAVDAAVVVLDGNVVARCGDAVDRRGLLQEPHALLEEEVLVEQCADGAEIDDVPRQLVVERHARENVDLLGRTAAIDHEFVRARHFAGEAHTARAHDATIAVEEDVRADVLLRLLVLRFGEAALTTAVLVGVILQVALTRLIAHRAIDGVVDEEELHHRLLVRDRLRAVGVHNHAFSSDLLAGRHELRERLEFAGLRIGLPDLSEADAAIRHHRETRVIAIVRDLNVLVEGGLQDRLPRLEGVLLAVDRELWHRRRNVAEATATVAVGDQSADAAAGSVANRILIRPSSQEMARTSMHRPSPSRKRRPG